MSLGNYIDPVHLSESGYVQQGSYQWKGHPGVNHPSLDLRWLSLSKEESGIAPCRVRLVRQPQLEGEVGHGRHHDWPVLC